MTSRTEKQTFRQIGTINPFPIEFVNGKPICGICGNHELPCADCEHEAAPRDPITDERLDGIDPT